MPSIDDNCNIWNILNITYRSFYWDKVLPELQNYYHWDQQLLGSGGSEI